MRACVYMCEILTSLCLDAGGGAKNGLELTFNSKSKMVLTYVQITMLDCSCAVRPFWRIPLLISSTDCVHACAIFATCPCS